MAIQMRRGLMRDFDPYKMLPGEWAVSIDASTSNQIVWMCFEPGVCKRMGTYEDFVEQVKEATADIKTEYVEEFDKILDEIKALSSQVSDDKDAVVSIKTTIEDEYLPQIQEALSEIQEKVSESKNSADAAAVSAENAKKSEANAKTYAEQAKEVSAVEVMTEENNGIGKPDGDTITVDENGTFKAIKAEQDGNGKVISNTYATKSSILNTLEEIDANTSEENIAGALAVKKISSDLKNKLDKAIILSNTSVNEVYETGIYFSTSWLDSPFIIDKQGTLICINYTGNVGSGWFLQIFISPYFNNVKVRNHQESLFGDWVESIYKDDMDKKFNWSQIASFAEDGTLTTQDIVGYKEFLIMYGFLYDISVTHIIPAPVFRGLEGAGIYTGDAIVRYVSDTSIQVDNLPENYRLRIFGR